VNKRFINLKKDKIAALSLPTEKASVQIRS
jgi:hypothetical protein